MVGSGFLPVLAAGSPEAVRAVTREWVAAESAISKERVDWERERALLGDLMRVEEARIASLEGEVSEAEAASSASDRARAELLAESDATAARAERVAAFLAETEGELRDLRTRLPDPLREEIAGLYQRIPENPETAKAGLGQRMQTVVSLLTKIRQFDGGITVSERIGVVPGSGAEASIRTLWLGLGAAYYLAPGDAGVGFPGPEGWEWESRPEFAEAIRESLALAENAAGAPRWIELPVKLVEGGAR